MDAAMHLEKGLLHGVLGILMVVQQVPGDRLHAPAVGAVQTLVAGGVAAAAELAHFVIGRVRGGIRDRGGRLRLHCGGVLRSRRSCQG